MIYFIQDLENKRIKIGESDDPTMRIKQIMTGSSSKKGLLILAVLPGGKKKENEIQKRFKEFHSSREWYEESKEIKEYIKEITRKEFQMCRVCGSLTLVKPEISDIKAHSIIHKTMRNGVLPYGMREVLKRVGWGVLYNKKEPVKISRVSSDDAKRLIAFSWWARAKQNGINEKSFDDFMLDQIEYLDARFDSNKGDFREIGIRNSERWEKFG